jgi:hypothetical protein
MTGRGWSLIVGCLLVGSCAAPPLTLYTLGTPHTLGTPPIASGTRPLGRHPVVISVGRVTIPDELDTEDILVRDGSTLQRSQRGRWASRLSLGITDRLTERLAARFPRALVTDRPLTETPSARILINISRLDVSAGGVATLDADWMVVPRDAAVPARRERGHFSATGPVKTDQDVVTLVGSVLDQLAGAIEVDRR